MQKISVKFIPNHGETVLGVTDGHLITDRRVIDLESVVVGIPEATPEQRERIRKILEDRNGVL